MKNTISFLLAAMATMTLTATAQATCKKVDLQTDRMLTLPDSECAARASAARQVREDVKTNFETVVRSYIYENGSEGRLQVREKGSRKTLKLELTRVETASIRRMRGGRYSARVLLRDARTSEIRTATFVVDFSSSHWSVVKMVVKAKRAPATRNPAMFVAAR
jgi:hypothetical protein